MTSWKRCTHIDREYSPEKAGVAGIPWSPHGRVGALDTQDWASWDITRAECCSHRGRAARREGCHRAGARALSGVLSFSPAHGGGTWHACLAVLLAPGLLSLRGLMETESLTRKHHADAVHSPNLASGAKASPQSLITTVI